MNPVSKLDTYPIPKIEDLFATIQRGNCFYKLDLSQAYQQLPLDEESKNYIVINIILDTRLIKLDFTHCLTRYKQFRMLQHHCLCMN